MRILYLMRMISNGIYGFPKAKKLLWKMTNVHVELSVATPQIVTNINASVSETLRMSMIADTLNDNKEAARKTAW